MVPRRLRELHACVRMLLAVLCAAYWFGNSGLGLALLWWESRRSAASVAALPDDAWLQALENDELVFAHVGSLRVVVIGSRLGRHEVFRDELSEVAWIRLRRHCCGADRGEAATGR